MTSASTALGPILLDIAGTELEPIDRERLLHPWTGGLILFARNYESPEQLRALTRAVRALGPKGMALPITVDHEGGRVQRFRQGFTELPSFAEIAAASDALAAALQAGQTAGRELRAHDVDFSYTPVLDLHYGRSQVIGNRSFGRDPVKVAELAAQLMEGLALEGLANCGKHFPGHGWAEADSHVALPLDERPLHQILEDDVQPYRRLLGLLTAVMPAHVVYAQVDSLPAGFSARWIDGILRREVGFQGLVISDDLSMAGAEVFPDVVDRAEAALTAGCDAVLICNRPDLADQLLDGLPGRLADWLQSRSPDPRRSTAALRARRHA